MRSLLSECIEQESELHSCLMEISMVPDHDIRSVVLSLFLNSVETGSEAGTMSFNEFAISRVRATKALSTLDREGFIEFHHVVPIVKFESVFAEDSYLYVDALMNYDAAAMFESLDNPHEGLFIKIKSIKGW